MVRGDLVKYAIVYNAIVQIWVFYPWLLAVSAWSGKLENQNIGHHFYCAGNDYVAFIKCQFLFM